MTDRHFDDDGVSDRTAIGVDNLEIDISSISWRYFAYFAHMALEDGTICALWKLLLKNILQNPLANLVVQIFIDFFQLIHDRILASSRYSVVVLEIAHLLSHLL